MIRGQASHAPRPLARLLSNGGLFVLGLLASASCGGDGGSGVVTAESIALTTSGPTALNVGQSVTLYVHASNANGTRIPAFSAVTWSSSNPSVASVTKADTTATVTGIAVGETVISGTVKQGVVAQATIRVGSVAVISVAPTTVAFTGYRSVPVAAKNVVITNAGSGTLASLTATPSAAWLQASFVDGNTAPNPTATLRLQPSVGTLADGTYNATVTLTSGTPGVAPKSVPVTLQVAAAPTAFKIDAVTSPSQSGSAGQPVGQTPSVVVRAADDTPVPGVAVTFAVSGGGSIVPTGTVTTNASGIAALTSWTLGLQPGASQTVTASAPGLAGSPITFTATALAASKLAKESGDNQSTVLGRPLPQPVVVRVLDPNDVPVPNATVTFATVGGTVTPAMATTNGSGQATVTWTHAPTVGPQTLTASLVGPQGSPTVTFNATATGATAIAKVSGDGQQAPAGATLPVPIVVRVTGANSEPVIGETVTFAPAAGSGSVAPTTVKTDANGEASTRWSLGVTPGGHTLVASISLQSGSLNVSFGATASPAPPSTILIIAGDNQSGRAGSALPQQVVARVVTAFGAPYPGATVTFAPAVGSGQSFSPALGISDANGEVRTTWTLGSALTSYSATVAAAGLTPRTINATAALPPFNVSIFTGSATKVPTGPPTTADQAVFTYSGPATGELALGAGGAFTTPTLPPGTYTLGIVSKAGTFVPTTVFNAVLIAGQITSLGTIPVAYAGSGTVDISLHACSQVGDANGTATLRLYNGINGDQVGAPVHTWTSPFSTSAPRSGVAYGIYTLTVTAQHNSDPSKTCAVYRTIVQHSATTTGATTTLPILTMSNP